MVVWIVDCSKIKHVLSFDHSNTWQVHHSDFHCTIIFFQKVGSDPDTGLVEDNLDNQEDDSQNYEPQQPLAK